MKELINIKMTKRDDGWYVTREREDGGESALVSDLKEACDFVLAHDAKEESLVSLSPLCDEEKEQEK